MWNAVRLAVVAAALAIVAAGCAATDDANTITITQPSAEAPFDRTFAWRPVPNVTSYSVVVFTAEGNRTFEVRDLTTAGVKLSEKVQLPPGKYSVQVTALRDGKTVTESPRQEFEIRN
jgi:uncharacterized protein (DUF2141 family)